MASSTVNIADFRRRTRRAHSTFKIPRTVSPSHGLTVVQTEVAMADREPEVACEALISENPAVFDIGKARAQRMRHRLVFRPIAIPRHRSNVIRFGEPGVRVMRAKNSNPRGHWTAPSPDYDLPPAA